MIQWPMAVGVGRWWCHDDGDGNGMMTMAIYGDDMMVMTDGSRWRWGQPTADGDGLMDGGDGDHGLIRP